MATRTRDNEAADAAEAQDLATEAAAAPQSADSPDMLRLAVPGNGATKPGKPLEEGGQGKVRVRVPWPHDSFEHGIDKLPAITAAGVEVSRSEAKKLIDLAAESGLVLEEVED